MHNAYFSNKKRNTLSSNTLSIIFKRNLFFSLWRHRENVFIFTHRIVIVATLFPSTEHFANDKLFDIFIKII